MQGRVRQVCHVQRAGDGVVETLLVPIVAQHQSRSAQHRSNGRLDKIILKAPLENANHGWLIHDRFMKEKKKRQNVKISPNRKNVNNNTQQFLFRHATSQSKFFIRPLVGFDACGGDSVEEFFQFVSLLILTLLFLRFLLLFMLFMVLFLPLDIRFISVDFSGGG